MAEESSIPIVPFGKYKGEPITKLISDTKYLEWCKQQDFFKKTSIYNICVNNVLHDKSSSKTPEHNKIQNMFLLQENLKTFISHICRKIKFRYLKNLLSYNDGFKNDQPEFEGMFNWDIIIGNKGELCYYKLKGDCSCEKEAIERGDDSWSCKKSCYDGDNEMHELFSIFIEVKPLVGDDYPAILRKMKSQIELTKASLEKKYNDELEEAKKDCHQYYLELKKDRGHFWGRYYLLVKDFKSCATSREDFVKIFENSGITVIFLCDVFTENVLSSISNVSDVSDISDMSSTPMVSSVSNEKRIEIMEDYIKQLEARISKLESLVLQ